MVAKLEQLVEKHGEKLASKDECSALLERLKAGHQTDGPDHSLCAKLLGLSLVLHHGRGECVDTIQGAANPTHSLHVWHHARQDGAASSEEGTLTSYFRK